jgi:nitrate reductase delta subunit
MDATTPAGRGGPGDPSAAGVGPGPAEEGCEALVMPGVSLLQAGYRLLGELLLYPEVRDELVLDETAAQLLTTAPEALQAPARALLAWPGLHDRAGYLARFDLGADCPLYLGHYLFDEPDNCREVGTSGRNGYMIEVAAMYRHFGLALDSRELPDFLPVVAEFLALSLARPDRDVEGLRARFVERQLRPALGPMRAAFEAHGGGWIGALDLFEALLAHDVGAAEAPLPTRCPPPGPLPAACASCQQVQP